MYSYDLPFVNDKYVNINLERSVQGQCNYTIWMYVVPLTCFRGVHCLAVNLPCRPFKRVYIPVIWMDSFTWVCECFECELIKTMVYTVCCLPIRITWYSTCAYLRKKKVPREHSMYGENCSLGFVEAVHLVVKTMPHHWVYGRNSICNQFANQRIYDPWSQRTRKKYYDNVQW